MSTLLFANNAQTTLAGPIAAGALSVNLAAGTGSEFPSVGVGSYFVMTLTDAATGLLHEIVFVTARTGDTLTVQRAQEGTTARSWLAGDIAGNWWTAGSAATMVQVQTLQTQPGNYAIDSGTVNNIRIALNPVPAALSALPGVPIRIFVTNTNTGPTTLTITGLPAAVVFAQSGSTASLPAGALLAGQTYEFIYVPGAGFEVATAKVLLSTANTWAQPQTMTNGRSWSGNNTSGSPQSLIGVDSNNQNALFAGPSGASAWRVVDSTGNTNLLSLGAAGLLNVLGGVTSTLGSTGTGNQFRMPVLADFASGSNALGWWTTIPSFGLTSSNIIMFQGGVITAPGDGIQRTYVLPHQFPSTFATIVISYGSSVPPTQGAIGAQPLNAAGFTALNSSTTGLSNGCLWIGVGW